MAMPGLQVGRAGICLTCPGGMTSHSTAYAPRNTGVPSYSPCPVAPEEGPGEYEDAVSMGTTSSPKAMAPHSKKPVGVPVSSTEQVDATTRISQTLGILAGHSIPELSMAPSMTLNAAHPLQELHSSHLLRKP